MLNCDGVAQTDYSGKHEQLIRHIGSNHITILLETRATNLDFLSRCLSTHKKCFQNSVSVEGRKGQGVAIYVHNSIHDLVHLHRISDSLQAIWLTIDGSVLNVPERVVLGGLYINP